MNKHHSRPHLARNNFSHTIRQLKPIPLCKTLKESHPTRQIRTHIPSICPTSPFTTSHLSPAAQRFLNLSSSDIPIHHITPTIEFFTTQPHLFPHQSLQPKATQKTPPKQTKQVPIKPILTNSTNSIRDSHHDINHTAFSAYLSTLQISIKRFDQIHSEISGNKYYKLKYNLFPHVMLNQQFCIQQDQQQQHKDGSQSQQPQPPHNTPQHYSLSSPSVQDSHPLFPSQPTTAPQQPIVVTFGGAFSNHIAATASATHSLDLPCIGIIRGEELSSLTQQLNPTLFQAVHKHKMKLIYIDRYFYKYRHNPAFITQLQRQLQNEQHFYQFDLLTPDEKENFKHIFNTIEPHQSGFFIPLYSRSDVCQPNMLDIQQKLKTEVAHANTATSFQMIPEGGTNSFAVLGAFEMLHQNEVLNHTHIITSVGSGGTIAGISTAVIYYHINSNSLSSPSSPSISPTKVIGFPAVNMKEIDLPQIHALISSTLQSKLFSPSKSPLVTPTFVSTDDNIINSTLSWNDSYIGQGYGTKSRSLLDFITHFESQFNIPLEPVYTGKMCYGVFDMIFKQQFPPHSHILILHTGGLQGKS